MEFSADSTVLVMCADEQRAADLLGRLYDAGVNAVGPVTSARMALTLAAQTCPTDAVPIGPTIGKRGVRELAETLTRTWGTRCRILPAEGTGSA